MAGDLSKTMQFGSLTKALKDVVAIPVTPYRDGEIDVDTFQSLVRRLVDNGLNVVTPNGNTSEFYALDGQERQTLIRAAVAAVNGEAQVLVGIGLDRKTAVADAELAQTEGAQLAMIHQPVHPHITPEGWLDYHESIANALPEMGFVPYIRNGYVTGELLRRLGERCPNIIGIKYALPDAAAFAEVREEAGPDRFAWLAGLAEPYALSYAAHGADGFTSGLANVNPRLSLNLRDLLRARDFNSADVLLRRIAPFERMRSVGNSGNNVSVVKEALCQLGLCDRAIRPPSRVLAEPERETVAGILQQWHEAEVAVA